MGAVSLAEKKHEEIAREIGSSEFAKTLLSGFWGEPPRLDLRDEAVLYRVLRRCAEERILHSAADISDGGLAVSLARSVIASGIGATLLPSTVRGGLRTVWDLFGEPGSAAVVTCRAKDFEKLEQITEQEVGSIFAMHIGSTGGRTLTIPFEGHVLSASVEDLRATFSTSLESQLAEEVTA
jgi:phosphoribosylformylglycinamidine synthase